MKHKLDIQFIVREYNGGKSAPQIAKELGCGSSTIYRKLRKGGVSPKNPLYGTTKKYLNLSQDQFNKFRAIFDGLLLSDAHINNDGSLHLSQCILHLDWIYDVQSKLYQLGIESNICSVKGKHGVIINRSKRGPGIVTTKDSVVLHTRVYKEIKDERQRWYINNIKTVPNDVDISSLSLAMWLCGDGTTDNGLIAFCTNAFSVDNIMSLQDKIKQKYKISSTIVNTQDGPIIQLGRRDDSNKIKDLVIDFIPNCFEYKLRDIRMAKSRGETRRLFTSDQIDEIKAARIAGTSVSSLSKKYDVSQVTIYNILKGRNYKYIKTHPTDYLVKLNPDKVKKIREMSNAGESNLKLAELFGVSTITISCVVNYKTWKMYND